MEIRGHNQASTAFTPEKGPRTHSLEGWVGSGNELNDLEKRKKSINKYVCKILYIRFIVLLLL